MYSYMTVSSINQIYLTTQKSCGQKSLLINSHPARVCELGQAVLFCSLCGRVLELRLCLLVILCLSCVFSRV